MRSNRASVLRHPVLSAAALSTMALSTVMLAGCSGGDDDTSTTRSARVAESAGGDATADAAGDVTTSDEQAAGSGGEGSPSVETVLGRYADCAALLPVVSAYVEGLDLDETTSDRDGDGFECTWVTPEGKQVDALKPTSFAVALDRSDDGVPSRDTIELAGMTYVSDPGLEAAGGTAGTMPTTGGIVQSSTSTNLGTVTIVVTHTGLKGATLIEPIDAVGVAKKMLAVS